jgi:hypothetical protein
MELKANEKVFPYETIHPITFHWKKCLLLVVGSLWLLSVQLNLNGKKDERVRDGLGNFLAINK